MLPEERFAARRLTGAREALARFDSGSVYAVKDEGGAASSDASASSRAVQYSLAVRDASRLRSFVCAIATMLFDRPFAVKPTTTTVASGHRSRIAFDAVALRTTAPTLVEPAAAGRIVDAHARNSVLTGTSNVRLFVASYAAVAALAALAQPL